MRTIVFAVALLILTSSSHAAVVECQDRTVQIDGHEVTTTSNTITVSGARGCIVSEEWKKDGKLDRVGGPAEITYNTATGIVTAEAWFKDGKQIARPVTVDSGIEYRSTSPDGTIRWYKDGKQIAPPATADSGVEYESTSPDGTIRRIAH